MNLRKFLGEFWVSGRGKFARRNSGSIVENGVASSKKIRKIVPGEAVGLTRYNVVKYPKS